MSIEPAAQLQSPVDRAYQEFHQAWQRLLLAVEDGGLDHYDNADLLAFMQEHEQFRNRTALLDHHLIAAVVDRDVADELCQPNAARVLTSRLLISNVEARRRVAAAEAVGPRRSTLGQTLEPVRPVLAAASNRCCEHGAGRHHHPRIDQGLRPRLRPGCDRRRRSPAG